ncbi:MAG: SUMF1/EgtB/PvdO family nonheme iron enzyme, partial [Candidatus Brocadiia bacterium]
MLIDTPKSDILNLMRSVQCPNPDCRAEFDVPDKSGTEAICPDCGEAVYFEHSPSSSKKLIIAAAAGTAGALVLILLAVFLSKGRGGQQHPGPSPMIAEVSEAPSDAPSPAPTGTSSTSPTLSATATPASTPTPTPQVTPSLEPTPEPSPSLPPLPVGMSDKIQKLIEQAMEFAKNKEYASALGVLRRALEEATNDLEKQKIGEMVAAYTLLADRQKTALDAESAAKEGRWLETYCLLWRLEAGLGGTLNDGQRATMQTCAKMLFEKPVRSSIGIMSLPVPEGEFTRGSMGKWQDEQPVAKVKISKFWMSEAEVTNEQYKFAFDAKAVLLPTFPNFGRAAWTRRGPNPFTENHPVVCVNWEQAMKFCDWLTKKERTGFVLPPFMAYTLPTEAQWEHAAGGYCRLLYPWGSDFTDKFAVFGKYSLYGVEPVRGRRASLLGLYDIAGNAAEWCSDWYGPYTDEAQIDPTGPPTGSHKVVRGGSYLSDAF